MQPGRGRPRLLSRPGPTQGTAPLPSPPPAARENDAHPPGTVTTAGKAARLLRGGPGRKRGPAIPRGREYRTALSSPSTARLPAAATAPPPLAHSHSGPGRAGPGQAGPRRVWRGPAVGPDALEPPVTARAAGNATPAAPPHKAITSSPRAAPRRAAFPPSPLTGGGGGANHRPRRPPRHPAPPFAPA